MAQHKIVYETTERSTAHRSAGLLQELMIPPPDAVTLFEVAHDEPALSQQKTWRLEAYFDTRLDSDVMLNDVSGCINVNRSDLRLETIPEENWVALSQAALPPVYAGRFTVFGSHDRHRVARGPNAILIDAGEAFGTAHHATTFGCLLAIDQLTRIASVKSVLDLGCGSAVLSIAVARALPGARVIASDRDTQSVLVAAENCKQNGVRKNISAFAADGLRHPDIRAQLPFDLVIANILAGPLIQLAPHIAGAAGDKGFVILSGILDPQSRQVEARFRAHGFHVLRKLQLDGWTTLTLVRRSTKQRHF